MSNKLSITTLNVGRCRAHQSKLIKTLKHDILVIPEPLVDKNNRLREQNSDYQSFVQKDIAILHKKNFLIQTVKADSFYIAIVFASYILIACYLAPSRNLQEQLTTLSFVISEFCCYKKILIGDFNVRSSIYKKIKRKDYNMEKRAELFEDFLMSHDLLKIRIT